MKLDEAIKVLSQHNEWRRGNESEMQTPELIGKAIDIVVNDYCEKNGNKCFCGANVETKVGDNRAYKECTNHHIQ